MLKRFYVAVALALLTVTLVGFVLPALLSAKSDVVVMIGIGIATSAVIAAGHYIAMKIVKINSEENRDE
jgi:hypothetical protein